VALAIFLIALIFHAEPFKKTYKTHKSGTIFITGISTGIGRDLAKYFSEKGYLIIGTVRKEQDSINAKKIHQNIHPIILDITTQTDIDNAKIFVKKFLSDKKSSLVGLINNAGITARSPLEEYPMNLTRKIFEVNYFGVVSLTQILLPFIRESEGRIINIGSLLGEVSLPFDGHYAATKFALRAYSDCLRRELSPWNIFVGVFEPGYIKTSMSDNSEKVSSELFEKFSQKLKENYDEAFNEKYNTFRRDKLNSLALPSSVCAKNIFDTMWDNPRPETRILFGDSMSVVLIKYATCLNDALQDFLLDFNDFWGTGTKERFRMK